MARLDTALTYTELALMIRAKYASRAVPSDVMHMQFDDYAATVCQVWDETDGKLHAIIKRNVKGNISILFKSHPAKGE